MDAVYFFLLAKQDNDILLFLPIYLENSIKICYGAFPKAIRDANLVYFFLLEQNKIKDIPLLLKDCI